MKLYKIANEFKEVENITYMPEEVIRDTLEGIEGEFKEKALAVTAFIKNEDLDLVALKAHKKEIDEKIKAISNRSESIKEYLRFNMEKCGITKIESPFFNITLGKPFEVVDIVDMDALPEKFIKTTVAPDKIAIKKELKEGADISGAKMSTGKSRLLIK